GTPALLLISAGFLLLAIALAWAIARGQGAAPGEARHTAPEDLSIIGGSAWQGLRAVFQSRYLLGIASYVIIMTIVATLLYFTRLQMVAALADDVDLRTAMFARIDFYTQVATLLLQAIFAGKLMKRFGVHVTLMLLPVSVMLGFIGLAIIGSLAALIMFEATF